MKKELWFYKAQRLFKAWKEENNFASECQTQHISKDKLTEHHSVYPKTGGMPTGVTLTANRKPFIANVFHAGKTISL